MNINLQSKAIPTHILSGFLGAGKTTVLRHLLSQKPPDEVWAILMNEFGEIGIDQTWIAEYGTAQYGIAVKEVLGGCLCCTSQLPMQIALARLLTEFKPQRLFIESTGLGHAQSLLEQLTQSHWQSSLALRQITTVVDGSRLHQQLWQQHDIFLQQIAAADVVLISHSREMQPADEQQLVQLQQLDSGHLANSAKKQWIKINQGQIVLAAIDQPHQRIKIRKQGLLTQQQKIPLTTEANPPKTLPYHYQHEQQGYFVAGWHLPKTWQFDADELLKILQQLDTVERIKGKLYTEQGWLDLNIIPTQFQVDFNAKTGIDNRLEIISHQALDWTALERILLNHVTA